METDRRTNRRNGHKSINIEMFKPQVLDNKYQSNSNSHNKSELELSITIVKGKSKAANQETKSNTEGKCRLFHAFSS